MSSTSQTSNCSLLLRRQLLELTKKPVEGFSAGAWGHLGPASQQEAVAVVFSSEADRLVVETGLVDEGNLLEWEIIIIGYVPAATHD